MDVDAYRAHLGLKPLPHHTPAPTAPERGHARGQQTTHRQPGQHPELRGIPLVGSGPGVITGTRPGDKVRDLEQAGRDILRANLHRNRFEQP